MVLDNIIEMLDNAFYHIHRIPTKIAHHTLNWSKYSSAKATSAVGFLSLAVYNSTVFSPIVESGGLDALVYNSLDSPEHFLTNISTIAIDIIYLSFFVKNWKRAEVAEEREIVLNEQLLSDILPYEDKLQRHSLAPTAFWYLATEAVWPAFSAMTGNLDNPVGISNLASIMTATACLYGARYALHTEFYLNGELKAIHSSLQSVYQRGKSEPLLR